MRSDLQGLEITKGELRKLSGVNVDQVLRRSVLRHSQRRSQFFFNQLPEVLGLALIGFLGFAFTFNHGLKDLSPSWSKISVLAVASGVGLLFAIVVQAVRIKRSSMTSLIGLLDDVDRFNAVIKAIDINDQIEAAGNFKVQLRNRSKVIDALKLTRANIIRALRTERILRENQTFIAHNPDLFAEDLMALRAMQVSDQVSEQGRFLNEALEIAVSVQEEMRELQNRHLS